MKKIQHGILLLAIAGGIGLTSCSDDSPWGGSDSEGGVELNLSTDGRVMRSGTRADDNVCPSVPDVSLFAVGMSNSDGSFSKNWSNLEAFNNESKFPIGDYTLECSYGDKDREGFELPCFSGTADVHVAPGETTPVNVVATLSNAMVSVRYTEAFTQNFTAWSSALMTEGHDWVVLAQDETRPAFIDPTAGENVKLSVTMTNHDGKQVTVEPAIFQAKPRHHYIVTVNATGNVSHGDLTLDIQFEEEVVSETVEINLGDDLFTAPAPVVKAKDFTSGTPLSMMMDDKLTVNPQFDVLAFGGLREVNLNIISSDYTPVFGKSAQLVNADAALQSQLASAGIKASGVYRNVDKMAVVNVKNFLEQLPAGTHTIQLQAKDAMTRISEPVELTVQVNKLDFELSASKNVIYGTAEVAVTVSTNSKGVKDAVKFEAPDEHNRMVEATVKSVTEVNGPAAVRTRADLPYHYRYVLSIAPAVRETLDIRATVGKMTATLSLSVTSPEYTAQTDVFSHKVLIKINGSADMVSTIVSGAKLCNGDQLLPEGNITRDVNNGIITLKGLAAATTYSDLKIKVGGFEKALGTLTTENGADVNNGDFTKATQTINLTNIQVGGEYRNTAAVWKHNVSSIVRSTPDNWANVNELTCKAQVGNSNTWFQVPSTFVESFGGDNKAVIRTVGYSHNGTTPSRSGNSANSTYYCTNAPESLSVAAGELFLGSYSFGSSASRSEGISFSARPATLSFDYRYSSKYLSHSFGETGYALIEVKDALGTVIGRAEANLNETDADSHITLPIPSYPFGKKAAAICVKFMSTNASSPQIYKPTGGELNDGAGYTGGGATINANQYKAYAAGSQLVIDNVKLGYDGAPTAKAAARRNHHRK